ncbi:MAG: adenine nucleotide alpha hydrolase [Chitinophagaceae bacterium]|nr:MAG: adenine nucleotide alpha hydrolase [Chitinophagaceae bacterium]
MNAFLNWSGGKDSALCLHYAGQQGLSFNRLLTAINEETGRIAMHGVPRQLLEAQAAALGKELTVMQLPAAPGMQEYEAVLGATHLSLQSEGFTHAAYGDLFLEDLRRYRESELSKVGLEPLFPLWGMNTTELLEEFIRLRFRAVVVAVNESLLPRSFCGRELDASFLNDLPQGVDPCGENGEYHSFVYDGPVFLRPVLFAGGAVVQRSYPAPRGKDDCFAEPQPETVFSFLELIPERKNASRRFGRPLRCLAD